MQIKKLDAGISVSGQIELADVDVLKQQGFGSIVNNRPDGEAPGQPTSQAIEAAARRVGMDYRYIPVIPGALDDDKIDAFGQALASMPGPMLAYCRTGTRSTQLWAMVAVAILGTEAVVARATRAGYDLDGMRPQLQARVGQS